MDPHYGLTTLLAYAGKCASWAKRGAFGLQTAGVRDLAAGGRLPAPLEVRERHLGLEHAVAAPALDL